MNGVVAAMISAGSPAHAVKLVANLASGRLISMEGSTVTMINGYPTADTAGIQVAANVSTTDYIIVGGTPFAVAAHLAAEHLST